MAKGGFDNAKQPKSLVWHPPKFPEHMMQTTGVLDSYVDFDHRFLEWELKMKYYKQVINAHKRGIVGRPEFFYGVRKAGVDIDMNAWRKMQHIWYYGLDILNQYDEHDTTIVAWCPVYTPIEYLKDHQKLLHLPALKRMNPVGAIGDATLGIIIRDLVPLPLAWEGHDIATMVTTGHWVYSFGNAQIPMFKQPEDVALSDAWTYNVSRPFWHSTIDILEREMDDADGELYLDNHQIIEVETVGFLEDSARQDAQHSKQKVAPLI